MIINKHTSYTKTPKCTKQNWQNRVNNNSTINWRLQYHTFNKRYKSLNQEKVQYFNYEVIIPHRHLWNTSHSKKIHLLLGKCIYFSSTHRIFSSLLFNCPGHFFDYIFWIVFLLFIVRITVTILICDNLVQIKTNWISLVFRKLLL